MNKITYEHLNRQVDENGNVKGYQNGVAFTGAPCDIGVKHNVEEEEISINNWLGIRGINVSEDGSNVEIEYSAVPGTKSKVQFSSNVKERVEEEVTHIKNEVNNFFACAAEK